MRNRRVSTNVAGTHRSIFRGQGIEFDQVVKYHFGDDIRNVDWNVTARLGEPYRKVFVEDREVVVYVVVEDSPALLFGSGDVSKREVLFELAGLSLLLSMFNRERVGLLHLCAGERRYLRPTRRRARLMSALGELLTAPEPDPESQLDEEALLDFLETLPKGALIVRFGEVPQGAPSARWAAARRRHQILSVCVEDPWERGGPRVGGCMAYDPIDAALVWLEDSAQARATHAAWREARARNWRQWWPDAADRLLVDTEADALQSLVGFLRMRGQRRAAD